MLFLHLWRFADVHGREYHLEITKPPTLKLSPERDTILQIGPTRPLLFQKTGGNQAQRARGEFKFYRRAFTKPVRLPGLLERLPV